MTDKRRVPISLDERVLDRYFLRDPGTGAPAPDDALTSLATALRTARDSAGQVLALAEAVRADRTRTPEAAALQVRESALKLAERTGAALDAARERVKGIVAGIETETAGPPAPRDAHAVMLETEIRQALARLSDKDRAAAIAAAFEAKDDAVIGAVLRGPAMLSGLQPMQHVGYRHRWRKERFPAEVDRMERLSKALETMEQGGRAFIAFVNEASASPSARAAETASRRARQIVDAVNAPEAA